MKIFSRPKEETGGKRKNETFSPRVSGEIMSWLKSMGADVLVLRKAFLCVARAIDLAWWEMRSWVKRGFLMNGFLSGYKGKPGFFRGFISYSPRPCSALTDCEGNTLSSCAPRTYRLS
ncbi:MAG: hypothetical protein ACP5QG_09085 [candidate division WOR-3 bacterium]